MTKMMIGAVIIYILFFMVCFLGTGTDEKNMISYYSYPDEVQEKIKEDQKLRMLIPKKNSLSNLSYVIIFTIIFVVLGRILDLQEFKFSLIDFLIIGEGLDVFDLLIIDMCWWRHTKRTKFSSIPDSSLYMDMKKHIVSFIKGIPVFAISALIAALILAIL